MSRAALALVLAASTALGAEVARDGNGGVLEVNGFYKNFLSGLWMPSTGKAGAVDANLVRAAARFRFEDRFEVEAAWQLAFVVASDPAFVSNASFRNTVGGTGAGPQRRLVELGGTLHQSATTRLDHQIDRLALKLPLPFGDLTVGRQVLSWGTGRFFNPTDVLSPFPPTAVDREVRRGFDAVRLAIALGDTTQLDLLYLPQPVAEDHGGVVRFQTNVSGWDGSISAGKYVRDFVIGFDLVGDIGVVGAHAEGAYTLELLTDGTVGEHFFRGVVGADFKPHEKIVVSAEYSYNGFGSSNPARYLAILTSARALRGEVFGAGEHVVAAAASFLASEVLSAQLAVLCNVADPSALAIASAEYSLAQPVLVRAGLSVPIGRPPDARGLRSEFGSGPFSAFVQLGLYLP